MESFRAVERQIDVVIKEAVKMEISALEMRDNNGGFVMIPLLAARAQVLHALAILNQKDKKGN